MSSKVVPSASFRAMWLARARLEWGAFCKHDPWHRRHPLPCLAVEAIELILDRQGHRASWAHFDALAFHEHVEARYPQLGEDGWFACVGSMAMFFDFLFRRRLVAPAVVRRTFQQCEALDPEVRRERERAERRARARARRNEAARARRAAKRAAGLVAAEAPQTPPS